MVGKLAHNGKRCSNRSVDFQFGHGPPQNLPAEYEAGLPSGRVAIDRTSFAPETTSSKRNEQD